MTMSKSFRIVFRFLGKSVRASKKQLTNPETVISFGGFLLSVAILATALTLLNSYSIALKDGLLGVNAHIYVYNARDNLREDNISELTTYLNGKDEVESFAPVKILQAMMTNDDKVTGVMVRSVEWQNEQLPIKYKEYIVAGTGDLTGKNDIVLGYELAKQLNIQIGEEVKLISPINTKYTVLGLKTGSMNLRTVGIYRSGVYETDAKVAYLNSDSLLELLPDGYSLMEVKLKKQFADSADYYSYLWTNDLSYQYHIDSWIDYNGNLFAMLVLQKWVIYVILSFIILIASFGIISNTSTAILDNRKEIGILKAIGLDNAMIKCYYGGRTLFLGIVTIVLGIGLGVFLAWVLTKQTYFSLQGDVYFIDQFTLSIDSLALVLVAVTALLVALAAAGIAMKYINKISVIDVIRNS